ncbi:hypothetical protein AB6A40_010757 [Gnathostoma spinigerum]|uniref:Uncharacterized protein n=1 Tax=Gnathostoma spinigerum TaxID=75299 RepID=A0ABD6EW84_9BILA
MVQTKKEMGLEVRVLKRCMKKPGEGEKWELRISHCISPRGKPIAIDSSVFEEYLHPPWKGETFEFICERMPDRRVKFTWKPFKDFRIY